MTDKDWENAVEGVDKVLSTILEASKNWNIGSRPRRGKGEEGEGKRKEKRLPTKPMRLSNTPKLVALDIFSTNVLYSQ